MRGPHNLWRLIRTGATFERIKPDLYDLNIRREWLNDMAWATRFFSADDHARMDYQLLLGSEGAQPRNNSRRGPDGEPGWRYGAKVSRYLMEDGQDANGTMTYDFTANLRQFTGRVLLIAGSRRRLNNAPYPPSSAHGGMAASRPVAPAV